MYIQAHCSGSTAASAYRTLRSEMVPWVGMAVSDSQSFELQL